MKDYNYNGIGRWILSFGTIYEGQFLNGELNGFGRVFRSHGNYYIGEFKNGEYHGKGKCVYYHNGYIEDGIYEDGRFI